MSDEKMNRIHITITDAEVAAIDDWGWKRRIRTRAEAIRRLVELGMTADETLFDLWGKVFGLSDRDDLPDGVEEKLDEIADALDDLRKRLKSGQ